MTQTGRPALRAYEGSGSLDGEQQHRLQEIGTQVARVTHELKVPLSLIDGSLQMLEEYASGAAQPLLKATASAASGVPFELDFPGQQTPTLLDICRNGVRRLHVLIQQLEDYTRGVPRSVPRTLVDLGELLRDAIALAACGRATVPAIHTGLGVTALVHANADALSRVFINLIGNAFDAVADTANPQVWVTLVSLEVTSASGFAAEVHVRDNGPGVPAGMEARIFRPFVSTKAGHSGLGLGLAIVKSIVEQHGGTIALVFPGSAANADAQARHGADFVVRLPAVVERQD